MDAGWAFPLHGGAEQDCGRCLTACIIRLLIIYLLCCEYFVHVAFMLYFFLGLLVGDTISYYIDPNTNCIPHPHYYYSTPY